MSVLICFAGAPGVGKTTAAKAFRERLTEHGHRVGYAPEYARDFIDRYGYPEHAACQWDIMRQQKAREDGAFFGTDFVVTDTAVWYSYVFPALFNAPTAGEQELRILRDVGRQAVSWIPTYHHTFYLPLRNDIEEDGIRDPAVSPLIDAHMRRFIEEYWREFRDVSWVPEGLTVEETVDFAMERVALQRVPALS